MKLRLIVTAFAIMTTLVCTKKSAISYIADLTGANEVPAVTTAAKAAANFTLNAAKDALTFTLDMTSAMDSAVASHIHLGRAGINGPVVATLWNGTQGMGFTGRLASGTITAADLAGAMSGKTLTELADSIAAGALYVNIHSRRHPDGEIRGVLKEK